MVQLRNGHGINSSLPLHNHCDVRKYAGFHINLILVFQGIESGDTFLCANSWSSALFSTSVGHGEMGELVLHYTMTTIQKWENPNSPGEHDDHDTRRGSGEALCHLP
jgi:hypothetical protein